MLSFAFIWVIMLIVMPYVMFIVQFTSVNINIRLFAILLYTYKKYPLILPIFLHKNTKSCITLLAFSDSVSPSSIVYPRRTTFTLVLYLGITRQRAGI